MDWPALETDWMPFEENGACFCRIPNDFVALNDTCTLIGHIRLRTTDTQVCHQHAIKPLLL